jgi:AraC-like DNA-binding protein
MAKQVAAPDLIGEALALREAGYTALAISQRLRISVRSLQRHFAAIGTRKGALRADVLQRAKDDLMARITCDQTIKEEAARLVADDLAHSMHLRELILATSEKMTAASLADAVQVMRAAAAYSTTIKNTSDIIRQSLRLKDLADDLDELPELIMTELSQEEIAALRRQPDADAALGAEIANPPRKTMTLSRSYRHDTLWARFWHSRVLEKMTGRRCSAFVHLGEILKIKGLYPFDEDFSLLTR